MTKFLLLIILTPLYAACTTNTQNNIIIEDNPGIIDDVIPIYIVPGYVEL